MKGAGLGTVLYIVLIGTILQSTLVSSRPLPNLSKWLGLGTHKRVVDTEGYLWAVLIAGSAGFGNYRHQSDIAHAYQILHRGGIPDDKIIVMVYDDIANNPENPRPGTIINHPHGTDNYAGMPKDYVGEDVNANNFLAVLAGNASAITKTNPRTTGRILAANPTDRIFVYFSDHGAPGVLGMPSGDFLYADQLHRTIKHRSKHHGFKEMVLYIEACESGSLFKGILEDDLNVFATTAANEMESSWGVYCPGMDPSPPEDFMTCLGDLYSVAWMEDSDLNDLTTESLKKQFDRVRQRTSQNWTYEQGSHVLMFGQLEIDEEPVANYLGMLNTGSKERYTEVEMNGKTGADVFQEDRQVRRHVAIPQRDADLLPLILKAQRGMNDAAQELEAARAKRATVDANVYRVVLHVLDQSMAIASSDDAHGKNRLLSWSQMFVDLLTLYRFDVPSLGQLLVRDPVPAPEGSALVSDWDCLRSMVKAWQGECGVLDQYGMKHTRAFANMCNLGVQVEIFQEIAGKVCGVANSGIATTYMGNE